MKVAGLVLTTALIAVGLVSNPSRGSAQQADHASGLPGATITLDGKQLPPPDPRFGGEIKERASESTPWWGPRVVPPKGAPNVLLIMTDDVGFGAPGTFGG
jgi:arylsulfatase